MADEIAQVCQLEIEGTTMVLKGSVKVVAWLAQAIKAISEWMAEQGGQKNDMKAIWKLCKDGPPQVIMIDDNNLEKVLDAAKKAGLRWTMPPDFNSTDGKVPICLPPQDMALFSAIVQSNLQKDISKSQKIISGYNNEIAELREKLVDEEGLSAGQKKAINNKIENLEQARNEVVEILEGKKVMAGNGGIMSFQDYLATSVGTEFEKDPEKAMAEYAKGVDLGPSLAAKECLQPIRSRALMPDSEIRFYVPEMGVDITRRFKVEDGMVYSTFSFKSESGEIHEFSDRGITKDDWNKKILPGLLDKAGILEDTPCRAFDSEEKLRAYEKYHNNIPLKSEENRTENNSLGFSTAEAKQNIQFALEDKIKGMSSAKVYENKVYIQLDAELLIQRDGKVSAQIGDVLYQFGDVIPKTKTDGTYIISIEKNSTVTVKEEGKTERQISALRAQKDIFAARQKADSVPMLGVAHAALSMKR